MTPTRSFRKGDIVAHDRVQGVVLEIKGNSYLHVELGTEFKPPNYANFPINETQLIEAIEEQDDGFF